MTNFSPVAGLTNPHFQTILPRLIRRKPLFKPCWQTLELEDGDFVDLAWSEDWQTEQAAKKPIFVLFHGLEGSFDSPYANGLMHAFSKRGWLSVMMHFRVCSGRPNRHARAYHSGEVKDARHFLKHLNTLFPDQPKVAVGISLGGNMLVNYLATYKDEPLLGAATVVSAPLDLAACSSRIEQGFSKVYRNYLLTSLKKNALLKEHKLKSAIGIEAPHIKSIQTLYGFDDLITAPLHGFDNADDYYQRCSGIKVLNQVTVPLQVIHSGDDPFMTAAVIPQFRLNDNIHYRLLKQGGHVGFISGTLSRPRFWLEEHLPDYYQHFISSISEDV
ncbi:hydrolase [Vibrio sp. SCSIO 43137]|uniref:hydrolase n=1 Tax=Vibrio sp. SCSIO 43137 TaxID=3021011 RepID=UPI002307ED2D|nr:hydrolase [Vibrio sp. SCSIO 43137]WCE29494.1 hydrolase [Vibrio sp. SCSIO 43137]